MIDPEKMTPAERQAFADLIERQWYGLASRRQRSEIRRAPRKFGPPTHIYLAPRRDA